MTECDCDDPDVVLTDTGVWCDKCDTRLQSGFVV